MKDSLKEILKNMDFLKIGNNNNTTPKLLSYRMWYFFYT